MRSCVDMRLTEVMAGTGAGAPLGEDPEVLVVTGDSREVKAGALFCALPGARLDGHDFAAEAARRGAVAVVAERPVECAPARLLLVPSARRAMALAAANLLGRPADALRLAAVTGTNGKTTVTYLLEACLSAARIPTGVIGTVTHRFPGVARPAAHTTPESTVIQALLAEMRDAGARAAIMEVSSHALAQERVAGCRFAAAGFTNLTRDHLDYHGGMDSYFATKRRLFVEHLAPDGVAVVNARDPWGARLADQLGPGRVVWRYGIRAGDALRAEGLAVSLDGIRATLVTPRGPLEVHSPLVGAHNVENLLCAAGLALALGVSPEQVGQGLSASRGAPGRLERIDGPGFTVFVDYAHTDDALHRVQTALRALEPRRLITVFGCGGDRDRGKRPLMGAAAGRGSDLAIVTSDNPRSEDPLRIVDEVLPGLVQVGRRRLTPAEAVAGEAGYAVEPDRRAAIELAVACARQGDAVLIAGKGHEESQIVGGERRRFDDREEARRALRRA
jgi:UDP-N-acetylmuramoyl-L-alanyl-D-glutamate--2,6-diaminopimelate ligase